MPEHMAHFVAFEAKRDPLPKGLEPRPLDEAEELETFLSFVEAIVEVIYSMYRRNNFRRRFYQRR